MKKAEYKVKFHDGSEEIYYSFSVVSAFCAATYYHDSLGKDNRIISIEDVQYGYLYTDITLIYHYIYSCAGNKYYFTNYKG